MPASNPRNWHERLLDVSSYPTDWQLTDEEMQSMLEHCDEALCTTNGDTGPVTLTARQVLLLLRRYRFTQ